jgi:signal peptidase
MTAPVRHRAGASPRDEAPGPAPRSVARARTRRVLGLLGDVLLTLAAVVGVVGLVLFVGVRTGKLQTLVVISDSMVPLYQVDDVLISRSVPASALKVGEVASLPRGDSTVVTHRVVTAEAAPGGPPGTMVIRMKGDANKAEDARPYTVRTGLVPVVTVPHAGQVIRVANQPAIAVPVVITVLALAGIGLLSSPRRRPEGEGEESAPSTGG